MKPVIIIAIAFVLLISTTAFAQDSIKCPKGTYYGLDNSGNEACRDIETNQIVDPNTGIMTDSQTGEIILRDNDQIIWVFVIISFIIMGFAILKKKSSSSEPELAIRKGWTEIEKEQVRIRQDGKCAKCQRPPPRWEYHHKDGDRSNNSLDNCEGLCPNCHSVETHEDGGLD